MTVVKNNKSVNTQKSKSWCMVSTDLSPI